MTTVREEYPAEYEAGFNFERYGTKPEIRCGGAYIEGEPGAAEKADRYSAFCEGMCDGTRARWAAGGATDRERELLEQGHAAQRARGIEPLPMPPTFRPVPGSEYFGEISRCWFATDSGDGEVIRAEPTREQADSPDVWLLTEDTVWGPE
jgi:hypothetical protein